MACSPGPKWIGLLSLQHTPSFDIVWQRSLFAIFALLAAGLVCYFQLAEIKSLFARYLKSWTSLKWSRRCGSVRFPFQDPSSLSLKDSTGAVRFPPLSLGRFTLLTFNTISPRFPITASHLPSMLRMY
ncbi:uncharacterized protein BDW70DRAFT_142412 [Aspergillus foveolatus]|uniref:uncharacterized protein n=1 Tax=Aspergillus foveolatus TaxID=210207 RepID=UPI003CCD23DC